MKTLKIVTLILFSIFFTSCDGNNGDTDAAGVFEATEIIVSAESSGKILLFEINEGEILNYNQQVGYIDSTQLYLTKQQLLNGKKSLKESRPNIKTQTDAIEREIDKYEFEKKRVEKLLVGEAATQKQLDDIESQLSVLKAKLSAQKNSLNTSVNSLDTKIKGMDIQIEQLNDQLEKCVIKSPIDGTVLVKYAEQSELTAPGKPLFKIADMSNMILKVYVTSDQLASIKIGQVVKVSAEYGESDNREYEGKINWISSKSEFTPKTIQTQNERANLVYAVKVAVKNDDFLKIGMYGSINITK